jgi:energy-coupling factor transporter ATP-binding protein EcfA2
MYISSLKIKNFRSLVSVDLEFAKYDVLIGSNDSGKSNVLKALNLFFNSETDVGVPISFERDFSKQAKTPDKKAREITIEVEFSPPKNYADNDKVIWKKVWRFDSQMPYKDELKRKSGIAFSSRSRTENWVKKIAFEYVPAIRGREFFSILKRRLHATLAATIAPKIDAAGDSFLKDIRKEVRRIETQASSILSLNTKFALPSDLGNLFDALDFEASDSHVSTSLQQRGDGIQGRHVPIILNFLAEQRRGVLVKGKPEAVTVWGYEEPENNLELAQQIKEADLFQNLEFIQLLVTTHSPAFYRQAEPRSIWWANRLNGQTSFSNSPVSHASADESLGLMPFLAPYLEKAEEDRKRLRAQISAMNKGAIVQNEPTLLVEGKTDKHIIEAVWDVTYQVPRNFKILTGPTGEGGASWVVDQGVARGALSQVGSKTLALLDDDDAGREAKARLKVGLNAIKRAGKTSIWMIRPQCISDELRQLAVVGIKIDASIEEMLGIDTWTHARQCNWLVDRSQLRQKNAELCSINESLDAVFNRLLKDHLHLRTITDHVVNLQHKEQLANWFVKGIRAGNPVPSALKDLISKLKDHFAS